MKKNLSIVASAVILAGSLIPVTAFAHNNHKKHQSCVTLYEHVNFKGRSIKFCSDDSTLVNNKWNDIASSAKVSGGHGVELYEHINYKGHRLNLKPGNYSNFTKYKLGKGSWNDIVSSVNIK